MSPLRGSASKVALKVVSALTPRGPVTIYMTHLRLHPLLRLTLVFTSPPSYNWPDSCDMSAKQRACYPQRARLASS